MLMSLSVPGSVEDVVDRYSQVFFESEALSRITSKPPLAFEGVLAIAFVASMATYFRRGLHARSNLPV